eukprot:COSAG06_NODE_23412_length_692_cov_1.701518_1_plen_146_part_10
MDEEPAAGGDSTDWTDSDPEEPAATTALQPPRHAAVQQDGGDGPSALLGRWRVKHRLGITASVGPAIDSEILAKAGHGQVLWVTRVDTTHSGLTRGYCLDLGWVTLSRHLVERAPSVGSGTLSALSAAGLDINTQIIVMLVLVALL